MFKFEKETNIKGNLIFVRSKNTINFTMEIVKLFAVLLVNIFRNKNAQTAF